MTGGRISQRTKDTMANMEKYSYKRPESDGTQDVAAAAGEDRQRW